MAAINILIAVCDIDMQMQIYFTIFSGDITDQGCDFHILIQFSGIVFLFFNVEKSYLYMVGSS